MRFIIIAIVFTTIVACSSTSNAGEETKILIETVEQRFHSDINIEPSMSKEYHYLADRTFEIDLIGRMNNSYITKKYIKKDIREEGQSEVISVHVVNKAKKRMVFNSIQDFESYFKSEGYLIKSKSVNEEGDDSYVFQQDK